MPGEEITINVQPGEIYQYKPPISTINIAKNAVKIGVSISEKDYMKINNDINNPNLYGNFSFKIKTGENKLDEIQIGKTYMYETQEGINQPSLIFDNAPPSLLVEIVGEGMN